MVRPDFNAFRGGTMVLVHSAKGSTWDNHKYIKRVDGTYYYPNDYKGGRHIDSLKGEGSSSEKEEESDTKVFDDFFNYGRELHKKGEAYWPEDTYEEMFKMSKEDLGELYENMTGVKLGPEDLDRLFKSTQAARRTKAESTPEEWETKFYDNVDLITKKHPGLFDPKQIEDIDDFRLTLQAIAGINTEDIPDTELYRMYDKMQRHYTPDESGMEEISDELSEEDIQNLANEVIRGNFGNGAQRKELLGDDYQKIQAKVNEILRSQGNKKISEKTTVEKKPATTKKTSSSTPKALNMEQVMGVYRKKSDEEKKRKNRR